uniref:Uncharacterized protein n=1 Tax=Anguilla anguilla TaxID=7936 RepID=A0A0E9Q4L9_ANGAN
MSSLTWRSIFFIITAHHLINLMTFTRLCLGNHLLSQEQLEVKILDSLLSCSPISMTVCTVLNPAVSDRQINKMEHCADCPFPCLA